MFSFSLAYLSQPSSDGAIRVSGEGLLLPSPPRVNAQDPRPSFAFSGVFSEISLPVGPCEFLPGSGVPSLLLPEW